MAKETRVWYQEADEKDHHDWRDPGRDLYSAQLEMGICSVCLYSFHSEEQEYPHAVTKRRQHISRAVKGITAYLAPNTEVFHPNKPLSIITYMAAGICESAFSQVSGRSPNITIYYSRPRSTAADVMVPCSASNLSSKGVRAMAFNRACTNPACIKG